MADMLSNTVGIMLFILAFTVLQSGGAVVLKHLPIEHESKGMPINFACWHQRLLPLNEADLTKRLVERLGRPSYESLSQWLSSFRNVRVDDRFFSVSGETDGNVWSPHLIAVYQPKVNVGDTLEQLKSGNSFFESQLRELHENGRSITDREFLYFFVYPDCINLFTSARDLAAHYAVRSGWSPATTDEPIRFSLTNNGAGIAMGPQ